MLLLLAAFACGPADDVPEAGGGSTGGEPALAPAPEVGSRGAPDAPGPSTPASERAREAAPEPAVRVVFLGTSLTAGYGLARASDRFTAVLQSMADSAGLPVEVVNAGVSGDTSAGGLRRLEWALRDGADVLVVELGANDGLRGQSVPAMKENLTRVVDEARRLAPGVRVVLVGMEAPPNMGERYTADFRAAFPEVAEEKGVPLVPFLLEGVGGVAELNQGDRIHPNPAGHRVIARTLWPWLEPVLRDAATAPATP